MGLLQELEEIVESKPFEEPTVNLINALREAAEAQKTYLFWDKELSQSNMRWLEKEGFKITEAGYIGWKIWFYNHKSK